MAGGATVRQLTEGLINTFRKIPLSAAALPPFPFDVLWYRAQAAHS